MRTSLLLVALIATTSCNSDDCKKSFSDVGGVEAPCQTSTDPAVCYSEAQICPDLSPIRFCDRAIASSTPINIVLDNRGEKPMTVRSIKVRGDTRCAFKNLQAAPAVGTVIDPGDSLVFRFNYTPGATGEDHALFEIESDAQNLPQLLIPVCGRGVGGAPANECLACEDRATAEITDCSEP